MISQYPSLWNAYCNRVGRTGECGPTSAYPTVTGMIAQSGDLGVAGYVSQSYASGSIGYVNYSYALNDHFPVAQMLNAAGYYTEPTPQNVAVSLLSAQVDTTDVNNPALYLTENLTGVYTDPDPRTYPLSSYSYLILPTTINAQSSFSDAKGATLAAFSYYAMCQGQQQSAQLGYSPMPINLVEASFNQIRKIPGAQVQNINIQSCDNPTFSPSGVNLLAQTAPYPPACDKQGPTQCTTGTGGAAAVATPPTPGSPAAAASSSASNGTTGGGSSSTATTTAGSAGTGPGGSSVVESCVASSTATCAASEAARADDTKPTPLPDTLAVRAGWSLDQTLILLVALAVLAVILLPGWITRRLERRKK
jgi:phosphate transport system substrate-binding protein